MRSTRATFLSRHFCGWLLSTVLLIALLCMGMFLPQLLPYWLVLVLIVLVSGGSLFIRTYIAWIFWTASFGAMLAASQQLTVFDGHPQRRARRVANLCADSNTVGNTGNGDVEWLDQLG